LDGLNTPSGLRASSATGHFYALFGRDSLWCVLLILEASRLLPQDKELAEWASQIAATTLRALASTQGSTTNAENEEQSGKIVHEYWPELPPRLLAIKWPQRDGRYYGSVDATYLYLMAIAAVWRQLPKGRDLVTELWDSVRAALEWALVECATDSDGRIIVQPRQPEGRGLRHHVWKDSRDSIIDESGAIPDAPIAWLELQGYGIAAFRDLGDVLRAHGIATALQEELTNRVTCLERGLDRFWLSAEDCPAMALTREKQALPLVSSNIGHILWCDALSIERAQFSGNRLLRPDLFTEWGLRTLSSDSPAFAPLSYHRGSIWPFDNAVAAGGLWRLGRKQEACQIGARVLAALERFDSPVELYCALPPSWMRFPHVNNQAPLVEYHGACDIQAWSVAAILLFSAQLFALSDE
jgi:glycogen debranching enzyme